MNGYQLVPPTHGVIHTGGAEVVCNCGALLSINGFSLSALNVYKEHMITVRAEEVLNART